MRMATCTLAEGGTIAVQSRDSGRVFRGGDQVDLDAIAVPSSGERPALTWSDVLGHHVGDHFAIARAARGTAADASSVAQEE